MMRRDLGVLGLFGVIVASLARPAPASGAPAEDVESLIAQGNELRRQGHAERALPLFQRAFDLAPTPRTEGQLGLAQMAAGDPVGAEGHLSAALESRQHPWIVANGAALEGTLARARAQIGDVVVEGGPRGAGVTVNGRQVGALPLASPVRLAAGRVRIEVSAPGFATAARSLHLEAGEHQRLTVTLDPLPPPPAAGPMAAPSTGGAPNARSTAAAAAGSEEASTHDTSLASPPTATASTEAAAATLGSATRTAAWAVAAGAVVGLGAGVLLQLAAVSSNSDFNNSCYLDASGNPVPRPGASASHCTDLRNSWSTDRTWSLVGYVGGAALAVTAGVLFWSSRPAAGHDLRARLMCVPGLEGISCGGVF